MKAAVGKLDDLFGQETKETKETNETEDYSLSVFVALAFGHPSKLHIFKPKNRCTNVQPAREMTNDQKTMIRQGK
ncbi:hypothetical protein A3F36_05075 [Candidatus Peribacteria bacterium RIFCSPHIGHO2_12_FULL_55_11]|nr:MAG: hypothetical protein A3F36_05075 [Candidatus Peribacteria bacterium RIFCSPHIGHO2_12_FULL_55_11]